MAGRTVSSFDPDADGVGGEAWEPDVWVDPFEEAEGEVWVDPTDDVALDTPTARADHAFGLVSDPTTPTAALERVAADIGTWDVEALLAEAAVTHGADVPDELPPADRPDVVVLRSLLRHPNRPADLATRVLRTWLEDPGGRSPWPCLPALAADGELDEDLAVTAVAEACEAARGEVVPDWAPLVVALAAARPGAGAVLDMLAMVPFPHPEPARVWPEADRAAKGMPGGVRARAKVGAEALGWDGRRLRQLPAALERALATRDKARRGSSFAPSIEVCGHGPVTVTPASITLPTDARGPKPYVAFIVGSHPVFRLKRDWPDRNDATDGTAWTWDGPAVLESRDLGCDACRRDPDGGKRYFLSTGGEVAEVRLALLRDVMGALESPSSPDEEVTGRP